MDHDYLVKEARSLYKVHFGKCLRLGVPPDYLKGQLMQEIESAIDEYSMWYRMTEEPRLLDCLEIWVTFSEYLDIFVGDAKAYSTMYCLRGQKFGVS
jgi:hypothetical protein